MYEVETYFKDSGPRIGGPKAPTGRPSSTVEYKYGNLAHAEYWINNKHPPI